MRREKREERREKREERREKREWLRTKGILLILSDYFCFHTYP